MRAKIVWYRVLGMFGVLALCVGYGGRIEYAHAVAPTVYKIPLSGERIEHSSPAAADFDGDGDLEIVIGGRDGMLYVLAYQGSAWLVVWSRQVADDLKSAGAPTSCGEMDVSDIRSAPTIGDLDDDGNLDIVVTTGGDPGRTADGGEHRNGGVLVYRYNGMGLSGDAFSLLSGWPQPKLDIVGKGGGASDPDGCWDGIWGSATLGDVDGDGDLEVAVEGLDRRLHLWQHDGTYLNGWPIQSPTLTRGGWATPAIADIDQDNYAEVIFGTDYESSGGYNLYVFNQDATLLSGFPVKAASNMMSSPAVGDIDGDGWLDIVVGTGSYENDTVANNVYAWDHNGNALSGWPKTTGGKMPASPALGDLDGDGDLEVIIGCGAEGDAYNPAPCKQLYAWHGDGSDVAGFPMEPTNNTGWPADPNGLPYGPVLADYDGDGGIEILVVNRWSWGISTVESNGASNNDSTLVTQAPLSSTPLVADVDNDGLLEIVIGGSDGGDHGQIYIWDMTGAKSSDLPWPMFHHDLMRTGLYFEADPPVLAGFLTDIRVFPKPGDGSTTTRLIGFQNSGGGEFDWSLTTSTAEIVASPSSGIVSDFTNVSLIIEKPTSMQTGFVFVGQITINATFEGEAVAGSPQTSDVYFYMGDPAYVYLPLILR